MRRLCGSSQMVLRFSPEFVVEKLWQFSLGRGFKFGRERPKNFTPSQYNRNTSNVQQGKVLIIIDLHGNGSNVRNVVEAMNKIVALQIGCYSMDFQHAVLIIIIHLGIPINPQAIPGG